MTPEADIIARVIAAAVAALFAGHRRLGLVLASPVLLFIAHRLDAPPPALAAAWWLPPIACAVLARLPASSAVGFALAACLAAWSLAPEAATQAHLALAVGLSLVVVLQPASRPWRRSATWETWAAWALAGAALFAVWPAATGTGWEEVRAVNVAVTLGIGAVSVFFRKRLKR